MENVVQSWFSSEDGKRFRLAPQPSLSLTSPEADNRTAIHIDDAVRYQSILGVGCSFDEATVYNLRRMPEGDRVLRTLVDPVEGIGWNLMRICFGSSDFTARPYYSYDDVPLGEPDIHLERFSIQKDIDYGIVDTIKKALTFNPDLRIFASPWSPPAWTKSGRSMCGGRLRTSTLPSTRPGTPAV